MKFSKQTRNAIYSNSKDLSFDIVIIGGGITGAGVALDAASRGLSVLLVEKQDFAAGTSSRSTKLVHGGLRYLKNMELKLVRDAGRERSILYQNAPHIVYPQKMTLPIYKGIAYGKFLTSMALWIYDRLAGVEKQYRMRPLSVKDTLKNVPSLIKKGLKGGVQYYEYRTKDARLVIENLKKSIELGAQCINYSELSQIDKAKDGKVRLKIQDKLSDNAIEVSAKLVINATGIWSDQLLKAHSIYDKDQVFPSKGIHIVVDRTKADCKTAVYFTLEDNRMIFVIPNGDKLVIGTTDEEYRGSYENVKAEKDEILYLLKAFNRWFSVELILDDVESSWAGIRSLILSKSNQPDQLSRKEKIFVHNQHFISVLGGKLTAYRLMAEKVVDKAIILLNKDMGASNSKNIKLAGANFGFGKVEAHKILDYAETKFNEAYPIGTDTKAINELFYNYGKNIEKIIDKAYDIYNISKDKKTSLLEAEIWYSVNYEMTINLSDFMIRRTERAYINYLESLKELDVIAQLLGKYLDWSDQEVKAQRASYLNIMKSS